MEATIVKRFTFEAAHQLPNHDGHCRRLHGHSYKVEVGVTGTVRRPTGDSDDGMVVDFGVVSAVFKENVHAVCDHRNLNDVLDVPVTTAENIAGWIAETMGRALSLRIEEGAAAPRVSFVRVWETETGYAEVRALA